MDPEVSAIFARAEQQASEWDHAGPGFEHVLLALLEHARGREIFSAAGADVDLLLRDLRPLVRHFIVRKRPDLAQWLANMTKLSALRGFVTFRIDELAGNLLATRKSAALAQILKHGVRRVDVLNFVEHGITKATGAALLPTARVLRGSPDKNKGRDSYRVVVHNDAYSTYEIVGLILLKYFDKSPMEAVRIAQRVHDEGRSVAGIYPLKVASKRLAKATQAAQAAGYPLLFTLEPDPD